MENKELVPEQEDAQENDVAELVVEKEDEQETHNVWKNDDVTGQDALDKDLRQKREGA